MLTNIYLQSLPCFAQSLSWAMVGTGSGPESGGQGRAGAPAGSRAWVRTGTRQGPEPGSAELGRVLNLGQGRVGTGAWAGGQGRDGAGA